MPCKWLKGSPQGVFTHDEPGPGEAPTVANGRIQPGLEKTALVTGSPASSSFLTDLVADRIASLSQRLLR